MWHLGTLYRKISMIPNLKILKNRDLEIMNMKNWKEERNYRRIKNSSGEIIVNIITIDGVDVEVTDEVFLAYSQMNR